MLKKTIIILLTIFLTVNIYSKPKVGLALSGGGARGIAHIGVLRRFEEAGIEPDIIAGASIGALVGSMYALGYDSYDLEKIFIEANFSELIKNSPERNTLGNYLKRTEDRTLLELNITKKGIALPNSLTSGHHISYFISKLISQSKYYNENFDKLKYKLRVVCSDIQNAEKVVYSSGDLSKIVMGSIAYPAIFRPVKYENRLLLDGGMTDNIPTDILEDEKVDIIILSNTIYNTPAKDEYNIMEVLDRVNQTMTNDIMQNNLKKADINITPELGNIPITDFTDIDSLITLGYLAADKIIPEIEEKIGKSKSKSTVNFENPRIPITKIKFVGNTVFHDSTLVDSVKFDGKISKYIRDIEGFYKKNGYIMAYAEEKLQYETLYVYIYEGNINNIIIKGREQTSASFVRNELSVQEYTVLNINNLESSIKNLYGTDLFEKVGYSIDKKNGDLIFDIEEKKYKVVRLGAHYKTDLGFRGLVEFANKNAFGHSNEFYLNYLFGEKINRVESSFYGAFFRKRAVYFRTLLFGEQKELSTYESHKRIGMTDRYTYGIKATTGLQLFTNFNIDGGFLKENILNQDKEKLLDKYSFISSFTFDNRNNSVFPTKGFLVTITSESSSDGVENFGKNYTKVWGAAETYIEIFNRLNFQIKLTAGTSDKLTPKADQFRLGGDKFLPGTYYEEYLAKQYFSSRVGTRISVYDSPFADAYVAFFYHLTGLWEDPDIEWKNRDFVHSGYTMFGIKTSTIPIEIGFGLTGGNDKIEKSYRTYLSIGYEL